MPDWKQEIRRRLANLQLRHSSSYPPQPFSRNRHNLRILRLPRKPRACPAWSSNSCIPSSKTTSLSAPFRNFG